MLCTKCGAQFNLKSKVELSPQCPQCQQFASASSGKTGNDLVQPGRKALVILATIVILSVALVTLYCTRSNTTESIARGVGIADSITTSIQSAPGAVENPAVSGLVSAKPSDFKIGVLLPLSGQFSEMGLAFKNGLDLYLKDHPDVAGSLRFVLEDHKYEGKTTATAFQKLRTVDQVKLMVVWGNTPSGTCAPIAEQYKLPTIALSFNPDAKGRNYVVTFGPRTDPQIQKVADQLKTWNVAVPGAVSVDMGNALLAVESLKKKVDKELFVRTVAVQEMDFMPTLLNLKAKHADGLLVFLSPDQALVFARQAAQIEYQPKVVGGDVFAKQEFREQVTRYLHDVRYVYGAVEENFVKRLVDEQKSSSYFFEVASGYTIAALLDRVNGVMASLPASDPMQVLQTVDRVGVPIIGVKLLKDEEYGLHFETESTIYQAAAGGGPSPEITP